MKGRHCKYCICIEKMTSYTKRSMFGGVGLFHGHAMFALIFEGIIYVKGGGKNCEILKRYHCQPFQHVKKRSVATINYFDISALYEQEQALFKQLISNGIDTSFEERANRHSLKRLRDLPNMQLRLERMLKKSGVKDVSMFEDLGAVGVFKKVKKTYQEEIDITLLWKFAGAILGCHWSLIREEEKSALLQQI